MYQKFCPNTVTGINLQWKGGKTGEEYVMQEISRLSTDIRGDVRQCLFFF